jgi:biopolymer transport protein ExbD
MVDVAFLLLIFFMMTTVFRRPLAMEVNMPDSSEDVEATMTDLMTLYVLEDGSMVYDVAQSGLTPVAWADLQGALSANMKEKPQLVVLVKTHRDARFEKMVDVLDALSDVDMKRFSVVDMTEEDERWVTES